MTISENLQNSNFPHFAHFDTFWFFSHNFQTNQSILSLKVAQGTISDLETGKGCVFNEQNLPTSKTHTLVIKPQEVNFK